jgi:hypothetical protein
MRYQTNIGTTRWRNLKGNFDPLDSLKKVLFMRILDGVYLLEPAFGKSKC